MNKRTLIHNIVCSLVGLSTVVVSQSGLSAVASQSHLASNRGNIRDKIHKVLENANQQLEFTSDKDTFSFRLSLVGVKGGHERWTRILAAASQGDVNVIVSADDKLPYAGIGDGLLINFGASHGEQLRDMRGGQPVLVIGAGAGKGRSLKLGYDVNRVKGRLSLFLGKLVRSAVDNAESLSYTRNNQTLICKFRDRSIEITFDWRAKAACAVRRVTVIHNKHPSLLLSDIRVGSHRITAVPDANNIIALWRTLGYPIVKMKPHALTPAVVLPLAQWTRSKVGRKRMQAAMTYMRRWPARDDLVPRWISGQGGDAEITPQVRASRKKAEAMAEEGTFYHQMSRARKLLSNSDPETRGWIVIAMSTSEPKREQFAQAKVVSLLARAIEDESCSVRYEAYHTLAEYASKPWLSQKEIIPLIDRSLQHAARPMAIRPLAYALEQISGGSFQAGDYPRNKRGWPRYDNAAIAWWVVHGDNIKDRALAWLARHQEQ